jgi:hypothetical protein
MRRIALPRPSVTACAIVAKGPRRFRDIAGVHNTGRAHHDFLCGAHGRFYDSPVGGSADDAKLWRRRYTVSTVLPRRPRWSLRPRRAWSPRRAGFTSIALVALVAFYAAAAKYQGGEQGADND